MILICQGSITPIFSLQRQFEDDDGGVCYIETHDHDSYTGHFRLRLIELTPTRFAFEIARADHKYVEVTYELDAKRFGEVSASCTLFLACKAETAPGARGCTRFRFAPIRPASISSRLKRRASAPRLQR